MRIKSGFSTLCLLLAVCLPGAANSAPSEAELLARGSLSWEQGQIAQARMNFEQAIADHPKSIEPRMKLGGLLLAQHDFGEAIRNYQETIGLDPNNAKAWIGLGFAYLHTQRKDLGRAAFDEAARIDPSRRQQLEKLIAQTDR